MNPLNWFRKKMSINIDYSKVRIPQENDDWQKVIAFARLINGYISSGSLKNAGDIANRDKFDDLTIHQLHIALFFEYRRFNHFGHYPNDVNHSCKS